MAEIPGTSIKLSYIHIGEAILDMPNFHIILLLQAKIILGQFLAALQLLLLK